MRLLPLGTNGFLPGHGRQTMSFLLERAGEVILLDAGSGVSRLLEPAARALLGGARRLDVVLTHYHLDHVIGLSYLPGVARELAVRIFAPAPPLTESGPEALSALIAPPLFPVPFERFPMPVEIRPYAGPELEAGTFRFRVRAQRHPGGSAGLRLGDELAFVTDTVCEAGTLDFVRGVGSLLHEVWLTDEEAAREDAARTGHSAAGEVADLARGAGVGRLLPVHHHPRRDAAQLAAVAAVLAARARLEVLLPLDGATIELGP